MTSTLQTQLVHLGDVSYPYYYGTDCVPEILDSLKGLDADRFIVVTDNTVLNLHAQRLLPGLSFLAPVTLLSMIPGDGTTSIANLSQYLETAVLEGATSRSVVVAFGGGAPGNVAGLMAALLFGGVRLVHVPTTMIAAMDSVISLKQAVHSSRGENHFGTYLTPSAVYLDMSMLLSLPEREVLSGVAEVMKNSVAIRPGSLDRLTALIACGRLEEPESVLWLLRESLAAKTAATVDDGHRQGRGLVLEYGHTIGDALELCDHRRRGVQGFSRGASVMFGAVAAARISVGLGLMRPETADLHEELAALVRAPARLPSGIDVERMMAIIRADPKRGYLPVKPDEAAMVILRDLAQPAGTPQMPLIPVPLSLIEQVLTGLHA